MIGLSNRGLNCLIFTGSIPDYPPPSFDEAIAAAAADRNVSPVSPAGSTSTHSSLDRPQPAPILIPPLPRTQNQPVVTRTPPDSSELSESVRYSTQAECDSDSDDGDLDFISTSDATIPTTPSEQDSPRHPTPGGTQLGSWTALASGDSMRPSPSQTFAPLLNDTYQGEEDQSITSPSTDSQAGDSVVARNSTPPVPPKRRLHILSGFLKSRENHTASAPSTPTYAAASQLSLPLNQPGSPSKPHRGESLIVRKLFGHKGKERSIGPDPERPQEPLETWDMLSDVERDVPPTSPIPEQFPCTPGPSAPGLRLPSPVPRRHGARSKHRSLLNHPALPPPLPLASAGQQHLIDSNTDVVPVPSHQDLQAPAPLATSSAPPAAPIPSSPPETPSIQFIHALSKPSVSVDNPTRGRALRATSSMVWASGRRNSPVPSPTRTVTVPTSPSTASILSSVTNVGVGHDTDTHDDLEGAVPPSPVQEEEEERFVTPPGSPVRSLAALPLANRSRHSSPVRHESRPGVSLRDEGPVPVPLGNPTRSDPHSRLARTPTITPRPSVSALHTFVPSNPSPLSNQSFERQAAIYPSPTTTLPTIENMVAPKRDTVVSIGDTESLIELYVSSPGSTTTIPEGSSGTEAIATATSEPAHRASTSTNGVDSNQHYPGRPLPHPPGASQSGPVRPVLLDLFLAGNIPAGLPPFPKVEFGKQRSASAFSSQSQPKQNPCPACLPSPPLFNQPGGGYIPPLPPPGLLAILDDDMMSEPSSPGSTYEMPSSPSVPLAMQREFTSLEALETRRDDYDGDGDGDGNVAITSISSNREARHLPSTLAPYCVADPRTSTMTERVSGTEYQGHRAPGIDNKDEDAGYRDGDGDDVCGWRAVQRERHTTGPSQGRTTAGHAQWACEAKAGSVWNDCGSMRGVQDAVSRQ